MMSQSIKETTRKSQVNVNETPELEDEDEFNDLLNEKNTIDNQVIKMTAF